MALRRKTVDLTQSIRDNVLQFSKYQHVRCKISNGSAKIGDTRIDYFWDWAANASYQVLSLRCSDNVSVHGMT